MVRVGHAPTRQTRQKEMDHVDGKNSGLMVRCRSVTQRFPGPLLQDAPRRAVSVARNDPVETGRSCSRRSTVACNGAIRSLNPLVLNSKPDHHDHSNCSPTSSLQAIRLFRTSRWYGARGQNIEDLTPRIQTAACWTIGYTVKALETLKCTWPTSATPLTAPPWRARRALRWAISTVYPMACLGHTPEWNTPARRICTIMLLGRWPKVAMDLPRPFRRRA